MEIYKSIFNTVVEPLIYHDEQRLHGWVTRLKQSDGEGYAIGEMLERALRYITMTSALADRVDRPKITDSMAVFFKNALHFHHRLMARFLRRRGWIAFYLEPEARKCPDDFCWLKLYEAEQANNYVE